MVNIISVIAPIFILVALGAVLKIFKIADENWISVLNRFGFYVGFPAIILNSFLTAPKEAIDFKIIGFNFFLLLIIFFVIYFVVKFLKFNRQLAGTYLACIFLGNIAYLGFPFITALINGSLINDSPTSLSMIICVYNLIFFGFGTFLLEKSLAEEKGQKIDSKGLLKNPYLWATLIGLFLFFANIRMPATIQKCLDLLAGGTVAVVLLAIGMFIPRKFELDKDFKHIMIIGFLRLIVVPIIFISLGLLFFPLKKLGISVLEAAMPTAIGAFAVAEIYNLNKNIVINVIVVTTIFSIATLSLWAIILGV